MMDTLREMVPGDEGEGGEPDDGVQPAVDEMGDVFDSTSGLPLVEPKKEL
jgi:hypothetical protein